MSATPLARKSFGVFVLAATAVVAVWIQTVSLERFMRDDVRRTVQNLRQFLSTVLNEPLTSEQERILAGIVAAPEIRGLELFSDQGRRVWSLGEPLELTAYRLDRRTVLTHHTAAPARFEIFWPAGELDGLYGLAIRFDTSWKERIRGRMMLLNSAILAVFGGVAMLIVLTVFRLRAAPLPTSADKPERVSYK